MTDLKSTLALCLLAALLTSVAFMGLNGCEPQEEHVHIVRAGDPPRPPPPPSRQQRAAEAYGFKNYRSTGPSFFECSDSDSLLNSESFEADTPMGGHVKGSVCCGWFKGCTVRTE